MDWLLIKYSEERKLLAQLESLSKKIGKEFIGTRNWCLPLLTAQERTIHS